MPFVSPSQREEVIATWLDVGEVFGGGLAR
jgi:hypothetical protein